MDWIKVTTALPPFGKKVLFRGIVTWKSREPICFFDDILTNNIEDLEYGQSAYVLKNNSDYLVSNNPNIREVCDQFVTHWCELPEFN
jgi:hypothetical protein